MFIQELFKWKWNLSVQPKHITINISCIGVIQSDTDVDYLFSRADYKVYIM